MSTLHKLARIGFAILAVAVVVWLVWQIDGLSTGERLTLVGFAFVAGATALVFRAMPARIARTLVSLVDLLDAAVALVVALILTRLRVNWLLLRSVLAPLFGLPRQFRSH